MITFPEREDLITAVDTLQPMMASRLLGNIPSLRLGLWDAATYGSKDDVRCTFTSCNALSLPCSPSLSHSTGLRTTVALYLPTSKIGLSSRRTLATGSFMALYTAPIQSLLPRGRSSSPSSRTSRTFASRCGTFPVSDSPHLSCFSTSTVAQKLIFSFVAPRRRS